MVCLACIPWHFGFYEGCSWWNHLAYSFFHANIFHLAINLIVLWSIRNKMRPLRALGVGILASYLPMWVTEPTMGLSGFLFASFGLMWGETGRWKDACKKAMPFITCTMIVPNVNGCLHLYAFWLGYFAAFVGRGLKCNVFHKF